MTGIRGECDARFGADRGLGIVMAAYEGMP